MSDDLMPVEVAKLAESCGISYRELSNAICWLNYGANHGEKREGFSSGPQVIRTLIKNLSKDTSRYLWIAQGGSCPFAETDEAWESQEKMNIAIDVHMGRK